MWTSTLAALDKPVFELIADAMEADIAARRLKPGDQLPTHRALARQLKLTVRTVTRAYCEAGRRGLTEGQIGRGPSCAAVPRRRGWSPLPRARRRA
jgi:DNA-binding transcriptional regulator YhcF (GntR family)